MEYAVEQAVRKAVAQSPNCMMEAARIATIPYTTFARYAKALGIFQAGHQGLDDRTEKIVRDAVAKSPLSMVEAARIADIPFTTFKRYVQKLSLYQPNQGGRGMRKFGKGPSHMIPLDEILEGKHPHYNSVHLKNRLIATGIKQNVCEVCGLATEWNGKPLVLTLDHKDGDNTNHRLENIRILCPNCHSQTDTFCGSRALSNITEQSFKVNEALTESSVGRKDLQSGMKAANVGRKRKYGSPKDYQRTRHETYVREQKAYEKKILASGIDFSKFGWVSQVAKIINQKPQKVHKWMQSVMPDFYAEQCFKRKSNSSA